MNLLYVQVRALQIGYFCEIKAVGPAVFNQGRFPYERFFFFELGIFLLG